MAVGVSGGDSGGGGWDGSEVGGGADADWLVGADGGALGGSDGGAAGCPGGLGASVLN
jgi:hypothetical protein